MNYKLVYKACGSYAWVSGSFPCSETNAVDISDKPPEEWNFVNEQGQTDVYEGPCEHEDWDITESEYDSPLYDDVM
jgi:hypothetical protein